MNSTGPSTSAVGSIALGVHASSALSLDESYAACAAITRHHARSFYYASPFLPRRKRRAAYAVYAFCRVADDTVDVAAETSQDPQAVGRALDQVLALLDAAFAPPDPRSSATSPTPAPAASEPAWLSAFRDTVRQFQIPRQVFLDLVDGVRMDLAIHRYETFDQLLEYCHKVAGVVGLMMTHIFGFEQPSTLRFAAAMGVAMQLTNIARDVATDARLGRLYVPLDWLRDAGIAEDVVMAAALGKDVSLSDREKVRGLVRRLADEARRYYSHALFGVPQITDALGRCCTLVMGRVYGDILLALERQAYDPAAGRAHRTAGQKVARIVNVLCRLDWWWFRQPRVCQPWNLGPTEPLRAPPTVRLWWPDLTNSEASSVPERQNDRQA